jgi:hypothetical protein
VRDLQKHGGIEHHLRTPKRFDRYAEGRNCGVRIAALIADLVVGELVDPVYDLGARRPDQR